MILHIKLTWHSQNYRLMHNYIFCKVLQNPSLCLDLTRPFPTEQIHPNCLIHPSCSSPKLTNGKQKKGWWKRALPGIPGSAPSCGKAGERKKDEASSFSPLLQKNISPWADGNLVREELSSAEQLLETESPRMIFLKRHIKIHTTGAKKPQWSRFWFSYWDTNNSYLLY